MLFKTVEPTLICKIIEDQPSTINIIHYNIFRMFFFSSWSLTRSAEPKAPFFICSSTSYCSMSSTSNWKFHSRDRPILAKKSSLFINLTILLYKLEPGGSIRKHLILGFFSYVLNGGIIGYNNVGFACECRSNHGDANGSATSTSFNDYSTWT